MAGAIDHVRTHGLESADEIIAPVRASCPTDAGPLRELAGVRFAQKRWRQAAALAEQATTIDPNDAYAWDLLGASRFVLDEGVAALQAWNHVGKPIVDSVQIAGNERTRQALLVERLGIPSESILTPDLFSRARRRFEALPDRSTGRVGFRPQQDGFANVDVVMAELPTIPRGVFGWVAEGARTAIDREVRMDLPGGGGQGQVWSGAWRWWDGQPRVSVAFTAPRAGKLPGVWRVEGAWEAQTFAAAPAESRPTREEWTHGGVQVSDWLTGSVQYHAQVGLDSWNDHHAAVSVGGGIERRLLSDRISLAADVSTWMPVSEQVAFYRTGVRATYASSADAAGTVFLAQAGTSVVTAGAPMTVWPGAGDGHGREPLLRAHPLLHDGLLEGPVFGRRVSYATTETRRWLPSRLPLGIAVAGFVDSAYAAQRAPAASHDAFQLDAGVGARIKIPGRRGVLRIDFGHGLRDGAHAISAAWLP